MPHLIHNGVSLHYEVTGDKGRPWLIFSNSLGVDLSMWQSQIEELSRSFAILRYDNRGHGASSIPSTPCNIEQLSRDVLGLADHVGAQRFHFCGLSMGGLIGQWLGLYAPQRVEKLVLTSTAAKIGTGAGWSERIRIVESRGMAAIVESGLQRWFTPGFFASHPAVIAHFRAMILKAQPAGYVANCAALREADFTASVRKITIPTLVICATHDPVTTVGDAVFLTESIADAQMLELDAAHLCNVEQADRFNHAVREFLGI